MTLSLPSALAAASRSANVPKSATLVAVAASDAESEAPSVASEDDEQAARAMAEAVSRATAGAIRRSA